MRECPYCNIKKNVTNLRLLPKIGTRATAMMCLDCLNERIERMQSTVSTSASRGSKNDKNEVSKEFTGEIKTAAVDVLNILKAIASDDPHPDFRVTETNESS